MREHWWLPTRIDGEEWLDQGHGTPEAIDRSLAISAASIAGSEECEVGVISLPAYPQVSKRPCACARSGAGGCTNPAAVARWARRAAISLQIYALDLRQHICDGRGGTCRPGLKSFYSR